MSDPARSIGVRSLPLGPALAIAFTVIACMVYANLALAVTKPEDYRYFPPFVPSVNVNINTHLGSEYGNIARSLAAGNGFGNPFGDPTGPTAWMPPILPAILAALWTVCAGSRDLVLLLILTLQSAVLIGTGWMVLAITKRTTRRIWPGAVAVLYIFALWCDFRDCFQAICDGWIVLLTMNVLLVGCFWFRPLQSARRAVAWGALGGISALVSPVAAFAWGTYSIAQGIRSRQLSRTVLTLAAFLLVLLPWTIRNYLVLGRFIPVKSNLAYELYQSHCLQTDGLLNSQGQNLHPIHRHNRERRAYETLGEIGYLDRKKEQVVKVITDNPVELLNRIAARFLGATLWYMPGRRESQAAWFLWMQRLSHPLPFLGLLALVLVGIGGGLDGLEWRAVAIYGLYLMPYILVSYYPRYGVPLLGAKILLIVWALDKVLGNLPPQVQGSSPTLLSSELSPYFSVGRRFARLLSELRDRVNPQPE